MEKTTKQQRIDICNQILTEIGSRGRRFFWMDGNQAYLYLKGNKIWYKSEWITERNPSDICFSIPRYIRPKGWHHGGTLEALIYDFIDFIKTGNYSNHNNGYGGLYCPHWGYSVEDMKAIQQKAIELGYLPTPTKQID